ncbi:MAG: sigma 54-interacting transcriptional regulator [Desulfobulbaceae bacterium]|nr:sigma 54-interacting transcriptional regulator [Desulfobulbaceae bacterium]
MEEKILLVDDDNEHLEMMERCLQRLEMNTASANGGAHAIEILKKDSFGIVVSDIEMPDIDGVGVLQFIKEHAPATDVILITGYTNKYSFTDVIKKGATDYLEKPFTRDALEAKVRRIFRERDEISRRKQIEEILKRKSRQLEKRVKELHCLYEISMLIDRNEHDLEEVFRGVLKLIPPSLQYPELTVARIVYQGKEYLSANFQETQWRLSQYMEIGDHEAGLIEVSYLENPGDDFEGPFLKEERDFINEIADKISRFQQRFNTAEKLREITEQLRLSHRDLEKKVFRRTKDLHDSQSELLSVFESVPDGIISVDTSLVVLHKNNRCMSDLTVERGKVFQPGASKFQQECHRILSHTLNKQEPVKDYRLEFQKGESSHKAFLVGTSCLTSKAGEFKGVLLIIHDITQVAVLEGQLRERRQFRQIVGESRKMQEVFQRIRQVASVDTTVLITGESGVGKELIVDTLHAQGDRASKNLVKVNCSALPENLLECELFGHVKGAFTGASKDRAGRIQLAEGGILFLDEIGDISLRLQLQLLRFLESKEFERVGESQKRTADVRVFAATNADLLEKVGDGSFREDLYYRLKVMVIHVPPLRERREDIPFLIDSFLAYFNSKFKKQISGVSRDAVDALMVHEWRGNIRELKHAFEHAFLLCRGTILELRDFPKEMITRQAEISTVQQPARTLTREVLLRALNDTRWHRTETARLLKISRATLYNKLKEFGLTGNNS